MTSGTLDSTNAPEGVPLMTARRRTLVLAAVCLSLVLVVAGTTMLNVALPEIARSLHATQSQQQWIVDAFSVALASLLLASGVLGDRYGRRTTLLWGIALFGATAAASAWVTSPSVLIGLRALAGAGAALIMPGTLSTITSVFPEEEKPRAVAIWSGLAGAGAVLGLVGSGAILEQFWWGSVFLVTAALAAIAAVATVAFVPATSDPAAPRVHIPGSVLSVLAIGGLVLGITEGPERGWLNPLTVVALLGGAVALVAFVVTSLRADEPLLDPRLFRDRRFAAGTVSVFLQFLAMMGFFFLFLQYLQLVRGYGTLEAALAVVPVAVAMMPASTAAARLTARYDNRVVGAGGLALSASGLALLSQLTATSSFWAVLIGMVITGVGLGLGMTPATNTIVQSLPPGKQGLASAVNDTSREMGGAFGIAILGSAFTAGYRSHISQGLHRLPAIAAAAKGAPAAALAVAPRLGPQSQELVHNTKAAFMSGQREALLIGTLSLLVGVAFLLLRGGAPVPDALTLPDSVELALAPARPTR
ncbi:MAG TPA: MFS transporter [Acidimicrobiales bacterium]|nr:MFS transporter [Acidimicrobiales bacterium]